MLKSLGGRKNKPSFFLKCISYANRKNLRSEVMLILLIKIIILLAIWWIFFRNQSVPIDSQVIQNQILLKTINPI
ncbi:cytochrome oxidase putative small subunit CydP [Polynucleobacter sphagniphilus]|uniref:cytochrome oxidase putative small subunit CydP n=1 Tax=Polynucleobacter sphagniphilus TaxID=1743169 RepID=UPI00096B6F16|nr:hypothetical protein BOQ04_08385 [Polynucleobacter sphagniphilus]